VSTSVASAALVKALVIEAMPHMVFSSSGSPERCPYWCRPWCWQRFLCENLSRPIGRERHSPGWNPLVWLSADEPGSSTQMIWRSIPLP